MNFVGKIVESKKTFFLLCCKRFSTWRRSVNCGKNHVEVLSFTSFSVLILVGVLISNGLLNSNSITPLILSKVNDNLNNPTNESLVIKLGALVQNVQQSINTLVKFSLTSVKFSLFFKMYFFCSWRNSS